MNPLFREAPVISITFGRVLLEFSFNGREYFKEAAIRSGNERRDRYQGARIIYLRKVLPYRQLAMLFRLQIESPEEIRPRMMARPISQVANTKHCRESHAGVDLHVPPN